MKKEREARPVDGTTETGKDCGLLDFNAARPRRQGRHFYANALSHREQVAIRHLQTEWLIAVQRGESLRADRLQRLIEGRMPPVLPQRRKAGRT
jgi:hypothetical protein